MAYPLPCMLELELESITSKRPSYMRMRIPKMAAVLFGVLALAACSDTNLPQVVDYNFDVVPILAQHCFNCHGPDPASRKAELALHTREELFGELREDSSRYVVVAGDPNHSELIRRVSATDHRERMPPPEEVPVGLTDYEIAVLERWIAQGAEWKPHWAFIPPERPNVPSAGADSRNAIDNFVAARLEREGLSFSVEADPRTLVRRLYLDLTGLPPGGSALQSHLEEFRYEEVVESLLASPHFGERMALHWLDLARFADTNGYSIDGGRHMWLWRDWLIHAFNSNIPFDAFIVEQLAGDLLPDATEASRVATGFHRNHMITHEGGTIPEENLTNYVVDRVKTTGEVFLGLTVACAQCHDHKYDPLSQRDYYKLFAFFNSTGDRGLDGDAGINSVPSFDAYSLLATSEEETAVREELARLNAQLLADNAMQAAWEARMRRQLAERGREMDLHPMDAIKVTTPNSGYTGEIRRDGSVYIARPPGLAAYNVSLRLPPVEAPITGLRVVFYPSVRGAALGYGRDMDGSFVLTSLHVTAGAVPSDQVDPHRTLKISRLTASAESAQFPARAALDERRTSGWSPHPQNRQEQHITATFGSPLDARDTPFVTVMLNFGAGSSLIGGHFRIFALEGTDDGHFLAGEVRQALEIPPADRSGSQAESVRRAFAAEALATAPIRHQIANLEDRLEFLTATHSTMVMDIAPEPRRTFVLNRGQYDQPLEEVQPGVPSFLPQFDEEPTRLGLARWLVATDNPLTARVAVNRFWQLLFGTGLVATAADFGTRGEVPSHPELLDWLAVEFVDSGFDVKALLRLMVMSATYRQTAAASPRLLQLDPDNRLLARGPRFRLQAEFIRDSALKISGLLVDRLGGPSVRPYQPPGLWKEISHYGSTPATAQVFVQDHGEDLYRRSLYTYWKRTAPPPSMMTFDAPTREVCTVRRETTNTPLQALVLLNDPQFIEASRAFAERIMVEPGASMAKRIAFAYEEATGRLPDQRTSALLTRRFQEEYEAFRADPDGAAQYLQVGESARNPELEPAEHAAWTLVASLLLNLSETITRS